MADFFQDITPPGDKDGRQRESLGAKGGGTEERTIRNIQVTPSRPRPIPADVRNAPLRPPRRAKVARPILWGALAILLLAVVAALFVAFRATSVTVTPRAETMTLDGDRFTAYPEGSAPQGLLSYSLETTSFEDSELVKAEGKEHAEEKASGTLTVYNDYSTQPLRLLKNTRFEAPGGSIFKAPAEVLVPGKTSAGSGKIDITVIADVAGDAYNVAPGRFSLPGLKGGPMYNKVYAISNAAMQGGFSGDRPTAAPGAMEAARSALRTRLEAKAMNAINGMDDGIALKGLARITYDSPPMAEEGGSVRIKERVRVELPIFTAEALGKAVASAVGEGGEAVRFRQGKDLAASFASGEEALGSAPFDFDLTGTIELVWIVDESALAAALGGKDESAFQAIVEGFSGVEEARARIEPFWSHTFPNAEDIKIHVKEGKQP